MEKQYDAKKWYNGKTAVILLCFFIPPLGFYGLWKSNVFTKNWKIGIASIVTLFYLIGISNSDKKKKSDTTQSSHIANPIKKASEEKELSVPSQTQEPIKVDSVDYFFYKGDSAYSEKQYKAAIKHYKKSLEFSQKDTSQVKNQIVTLINIGVAYSYLKNKSQTIRYYKQAYELEGKGGKACEYLRNATTQKIISGYYNYSICRDGTTSSATGRGACSHHGGVSRRVSQPTYSTKYTIDCN